MRALIGRDSRTTCEEKQREHPHGQELSKRYAADACARPVRRERRCAGQGAGAAGAAWSSVSGGALPFGITNAKPNTPGRSSPGGMLPSS